MQYETLKYLLNECSIRTAKQTLICTYLNHQFVYLNLLEKWTCQCVYVWCLLDGAMDHWEESGADPGDYVSYNYREKKKERISHVCTATDLSSSAFTWDPQLLNYLLSFLLTIQCHKIYKIPAISINVSDFIGSFMDEIMSCVISNTQRGPKGY